MEKKIQNQLISLHLKISQLYYEDNFKSDIENIDEYSGYIKVVNSTGHQKFLITIYNDKFGIENASLTSLKKYKVEVNKASNVKKLDNIIKCYEK